MHTPETKRDAQLRDLGLDDDLLGEFSDLPVTDLDIPFAPLDLPAPQDVAPSVSLSDLRAGSVTPSAVRGADPKSVRITIRIPRTVLEGFKARAAEGTVGYQTLMVRALRGWLTTASRGE